MTEASAQSSDQNHNRDGAADNRPPGESCRDRMVCPICGSPGIERKQKWHCSRCGQLLQTCCD